MSLHVERGGTGRDLVLLHGWGLHGGVWAPVAKDLASRFRVHAVDFPGHGHSAAIAFRGLDETVDETAAVIPRDAIVCGWSFGGLVALRLARRHPGRVRALALVGTTPCFVARADWPHAMSAGTLASFAESLGRDLGGTLKTFIALNALGGANGRGAMRGLAAEIALRGEPDASALERGLAVLRETDLRDEAPGIAQPAAVIHGTRDALAPVEAGRWLAANLPRATLTEIADGAHLPFLTHRAQFAHALEALDG
jgi:pimeloyl-[acyl-carrier protein] methyl ester esterase